MSFLAGLTLMAIVFVTGSSPASAWAYEGSGGTPGGVTGVYPAQLIDAYIAGNYQATFMQNGSVVTKSRAFTGAQDVMVLYLTQIWTNAGWQTVTTNTGSVRIGATTASMRLPNLYVAPNSMKGYYRVVQGIFWFKAGTDQQLGVAIVAPSVNGDMQCVTNQRPCAQYPGYLRYGRLNSLGGGW